jgi:hypothetical protein
MRQTEGTGGTWPDTGSGAGTGRVGGVGHLGRRTLGRAGLGTLGLWAATAAPGAAQTAESYAPAGAREVTPAGW